MGHSNTNIWSRAQGNILRCSFRFETRQGTAAAKSLQSYLTLCDPHRRQPTRLPRPWDSPGKNTGVGCHFLFQCMQVKSESEVAQTCPTPSVILARPLLKQLDLSGFNSQFLRRAGGGQANRISISSYTHRFTQHSPASLCFLH